MGEIDEQQKYKFSFSDDDVLFHTFLPFLYFLDKLRGKNVDKSTNENKKRLLNRDSEVLKMVENLYFIIIYSLLPLQQRRQR